MDIEADDRRHELIVFTLGRQHRTHNRWVAMAALTFRAAPYEWMAPWELEAWESLHPDTAWRYYRLGVDAGPMTDSAPGARWRKAARNGEK